VSAPLKVQWFGCTDRGRLRPNNEDAFLGVQFDAQEVHHLGKHGEASCAEHDHVFAVSDGMGGAKAGEYASSIAVEKITALLPRSFRRTTTGAGVDVPAVLTELFRQTHRALKYLGSSYAECQGMEATLSLCWLMPGRLHFAHVGDSRIYRVEAGTGRMTQLTEDDTYVGWLFRNGKLNEREARTHPRRNVLQRALGGDNQFVDPQVGEVPVNAGDTLVLCTDGLVDGLYNEQVLELLGEASTTAGGINQAERLVREAITRGSRDNVTAQVVRLD
ncbi:MAG: serine/threonine-protein phosphatase, partial [Verrucomicrobiales bacterium]|nr:serine/threonine-protein phosphatase [Verrucomicrobiales bacterium]